MYIFTIKAKLPSLNDYIDVCRRNKYQAAQFKNDVEETIGWSIKQALTVGALRPVNECCTIHFVWHEATRKRDVDNVQSSQKFVLDALRKYKVLKNDSPKYVKNTYHEIVYDGLDLVTVTIKGCNE